MPIKYSFGDNINQVKLAQEDWQVRHLSKIKNEKKLLGTAGTLLNNIEFIGNDDVCLIHADNYCLTDLSKFREAHQNRPKRCLMTMMIFNIYHQNTIQKYLLIVLED